MDTVRYESAIFDTVQHNETTETFKLNGLYTIIENYTNKEYTGEEIAKIDGEIGTIYHCKKPYYRGNILCKTDDPNAKEMIELMVKSSCATKPLPDYLETSQTTKVQMRWGTICPTKEDIFRYKNYKFTLYGRYIYGYDHTYVRFVNKTPPKKSLEPENTVEGEDSDEYSDMESIDSSYEKENIIPPNSLNEKEIILATLRDSSDYYLDDYNYSFAILDENDVLVAFAVYA